MTHEIKSTRDDGTALAHRDLYFSVCNFANIYRGNYLEIGCYEGIGLAGLANIGNRTPGNKETKKYYGIDPFLGDEFVAWNEHLALQEDLEGTDEEAPLFIPLTEQKENLYHNISPYENITFFETTTEDFMDSKTDDEIKDMNISVCLVDGSHHYEYVKKDWELALKAIGDKAGVIVFDDTHEEGVAAAMMEFEEHFIDEHSDRDLFSYAYTVESIIKKNGVAEHTQPIFKLYMIADKEKNSFTTDSDLKVGIEQPLVEQLESLCKVMCNVDEYNKYAEKMSKIDQISPLA